MRNTILAVFVLSAVFVSTVAKAATETVNGYTWTYEVSGSSVTVKGISPKPTGSLTIPSTLGGKTVTEIGFRAFYWCTRLTSVTIPSSVTSIVFEAFSGCTSLTSVTIPSSVTSIDDGTFSGCINLTSFSVASGNSSYKSTSGLLLTKDGKTLVAVPGSLASVTIPSSVTSIGDEAFRDCRSLTSVTIPSSVTSIGDEAFRDCRSLTSVTIPSSVTSIGFAAFNSCSSLTSFSVASGNSSYKSTSGLLLTKDGKTLVAVPGGLASVTIPSSVTSIGFWAFHSCDSLTSVTIPSSVTSIGYNAFYGCTSLASVTIPSSVTSISFAAFTYCTSLTSVTIPSSVTSIGEDAFNRCDSLTSVRVHNCLLNLDNAGIPETATITIVHNEKTTISAIEPTCTTDGRTAGTACSRCGVTLEASTVVPALGGEHIRTVTKPAVEPTSGADGCTEEITCSRCGTILQASESIPALGYIRNVTARQIWPHKKVEVCYEVADDIGDILLDSENTPIVLTSTYGATTNTATKIYGNASCAPGHHICVWDCEADSVSINQANVAFTVSFRSSGLSVKYYDISSSGYSTWISSEASMLDYFASKTPTIATNTLAWGSGLSSGFTKLYNERQNLIINAGMTLESNGCRYHGKYALADTDYFATFFDGYIQIDKAGTYSFKGFADDYFVLYIDGVRICNAQFPSIGEGSYSLSAGIHRISGATYETGNEHGATIQWKKPGDTGYTPIPQSVLFRGSGLSVKYYDISSSGYSTWISSEAAMLDYFALKTPTIATNTLAWGSGLSSEFSGMATTNRNEIINAGMTLESDGCRYHGKYALKDTEYFATFFDGYIQIDKAGTYSFKGFADDYFVFYIDGVRICNAQWPSIGEGSYSLSAGIHRISGATYEGVGNQGVTIQWKKPGDTGYTPIPQSVLFNKEEGSVTDVAVNTSSSVADGMSVSGPMNLDYSPFAAGEVTLFIDGVAALSTTNSGLFAWTPCTTGSHTLKHVSGEYTWTRTVNVTETTLDGHNPQTTISAIEPTCTTNGRTAEVVCTRCGVTLETSTVVTALGHDEVITKPAVEPTTETEGRTAEISCSRCHKVLQAQTTIPALTDPSVDPSDPDDNDQVTNLMIRQRYPWNGLVDIDYTIGGESIGGHLVFSICVKDIAGATNLPMRTVYKADGTMVNPDGEKVTSGTYRWVWDAAADLPDGFKCERVRLEANVIVE